MSKPGAKNPPTGKESTLVVTADTAMPTAGFRIVVSTQGSLFVTYKRSPDVVCELVFPTGKHHEPGMFAKIWKDATIVTNPVDKIITYGE